MIEYSLLGLIGWPLNHSLSPIMQNAALNACYIEGRYSLYPIAPFPEGAKMLAELLECMRNGELNGLNVTVPHKINVMPFLDELTPTAKMVGAVNTILCERRSLIGENTDACGFMEDIAQYIQLEKRGQALVLGAGGGARAVVYALVERGWKVFVVSRRAGQAAQLVADFAELTSKPVALSCGLTDVIKQTENMNIQLLINATPLGMPPHESSSPWPAHVRLPEGCFVYDLIYAPAETLLLRSAKEQGLRTANGLGMLVRQAAQSFLLWSNMPADRLPFIHNIMQDAIATISGAQ